ncbi:retrovirus-related pol polyprotein from transposon TNT 1-94 [Tanacetum coccineum]
MTESPLVDSGFAVPVFSPRDDPIACLNKTMAFLTAVAFLSSGGNNSSGQARIVKCYNCQGEGHMARQCTQPKRPRNAAWYKDKGMLAEGQDAGKILDEEQLAFLADQVSEISQNAPPPQAVPHDQHFQLEDFEQSQAVDFTNIEIHSDSNIISYSQHLQEIQQANVQNTNLQAPQDLMILSVIEQMSEQMINHVNNWEKQ